MPLRQSPLFAPMAGLPTLLSIILPTILLAGCSSKKVRVEMATSGEGVERTFASNALDDEDRARLSEVYGSGPQDDAGTGGVRFDGRFAAGLPSEVGNRSGLTERATGLGSVWLYFERFDGATSVGADAGAPTDLSATPAPASDWQALQERMAAGELWVRLFARWAERSIEDASRKEEFRIWVEESLVPFANDFMLRYGAMQSVAQSARVGGRIRDRDERASRTDDESMFMRIFVPLLLLMGSEGGAPDSLAARSISAGVFTPEEIHSLLLLSLDGNAGGRGRDWSLDQIFLPAVNRHVQRWVPGSRPLTYGQISLAGIGFLLWATTSPQRDDILLASSAIPEAAKARIRAGDRGIPLPAPYGADPRRSPKSVDTEVRLSLAEAPYLSNGVWNPDTRELVFASRFYAGPDRTTIYQPIYYAAWAVPDEDRQRRVFGEVVLRGESLAQYAIWRDVMREEERRALDAAIAGAESGRRSGLAAMLDDEREQRDAPEALKRWVRRFAEQ